MPSEHGPLTTVRLVELAVEADFPHGVVNLVLGDCVVVESLAAHPDVVGMSFVGSSEIAELAYKMVTSHGKRCQSQGGSKNLASFRSFCCPSLKNCDVSGTLPSTKSVESVRVVPLKNVVSDPLSQAEIVVVARAEMQRLSVDLEGGIKSLGDHKVRIELHSEVTPEIDVTVDVEE